MITSESLETFLFSLKRTKAKTDLDLIKKVTEHLGSPEKKFPVIHVGGTNGKGSVCAMIESIYRSANYKVGMYTSPHLISLEERIQINREPISRDVLIDYCNKLQDILSKLDIHDISFFEWMTAVAFWYFSDQKIDLGIIEVGIGGRLDATNVVQPVVSVITSVGLDHTEMLGNTVSEIAREKAGIIKPNRPVVIGNLERECENAIAQIAKENSSELKSVTKRFGGDFIFYPKTSLDGIHQRENAGIAQLVCETARDTLFVNDESIEIGLRNVRWDGRWQIVNLQNGLRLILDVTHNDLGMFYLMKLLKRWKKRHYFQRFAIVSGVLGQKRAHDIIPKLAQYTKEFIFVKPNDERSVDPEELMQMLPEFYKGKKEIKTISELFSDECFLKSEHERMTVLVTGSVYLIGEVLSILQKTSMCFE